MLQVKKTQWTLEETRLLEEAIRVHGKDINKIASLFETRTKCAVATKIAHMKAKLAKQPLLSFGSIDPAPV
jgi:hypothetical protein